MAIAESLDDKQATLCCYTANFFVIYTSYNKQPENQVENHILQQNKNKIVNLFCKYISVKRVKSQWEVIKRKKYMVTQTH